MLEESIDMQLPDYVFAPDCLLGSSTSAWQSTSLSPNTCKYQLPPSLPSSLALVLCNVYIYPRHTYSYQDINLSHEK